MNPKFIFDLQRFVDYPITGTFGYGNDWNYELTADGTLTITGMGGAMPNPGFSNDIKSLITSITLPASVTSIDDGAFRDCFNLTSVDLSNCMNLTSIGDYAFSDRFNLTSVDLSNCMNLTSIGASAFENCTSLTSITLPASLETIGDYAFRDCFKLTSVDLSNCTNLTSIGASAFFGTILTSVDLSNCMNLTSIGDYAFSDRFNLTSVDLSNCTSLTSIGYQVFHECYNLTEVNFGVAGKAVIIDGKDPYTGIVNREVLGTGIVNIKHAISEKGEASHSEVNLSCLDLENVFTSV